MPTDFPDRADPAAAAREKALSRWDSEGGASRTGPAEGEGDRPARAAAAKAVQRRTGAAQGARDRAARTSSSPCSPKEPTASDRSPARWRPISLRVRASRPTR